MLIPSAILDKLLLWEMLEEIVKIRYKRKDNKPKVMNKRELKKDISQLQVKTN